MTGDPGRSVVAERMRSVDDLTGWVAEVLDGLGVESAAVVGHSYGAMIGLAFACRYPERTDRVVLLDPNSLFAGMRTGYLLRALPLLVRPSARRQRALIGWETAGASIEVDEDWTALVADGAEHFPVTPPVVPRRPRRRDLERVLCPVTVVLAGRSRIHRIGRVAKRARKVLPHARIVVVPDASHHTMPTAPAAEVTAAVSAALCG